MDVEKVLTPNWSEECRGIYEAYKAPDVGRVNLDSKRVADDVLALLAEQEVLLGALAAVPAPPRDTRWLLDHGLWSIQSCCGVDINNPHDVDCWWGIIKAILARARGQEVEHGTV